ncbi:MAG: aminotransferase class V-fold PLP-dependent enzyme [Bacteroidota bacterium]
MRKTFFTPGPAQMYPGLQDHVQQAFEDYIPSISHRSKQFEHIHRHTVEALRAVMGFPLDFQVFFHSSATEIWERLLQNCVFLESFHFVNGAFSERFFDIACQLNLGPYKQEVSWGEGFNFLNEEVPATVEMLNFTHNETSTGVMTPVESVYSFKDSHPDAIITLDTVSSAPYVQVDWGKVDAVYFSVQKCFGLPAGLGVLILSSRAIQRSNIIADSGTSTGSYHSFQAQEAKALKHQTPETPNVLGIYLLGKVCEDLAEGGIGRLRWDTNGKAALMYDFFEKHDRFEPFVQDRSVRSRTVLVMDVAEGSHGLLSYLGEKGLILGDGYGKMKGQQIRIANFPAISMEQVEELLAAIQAFDKG